MRAHLFIAIALLSAYTGSADEVEFTVQAPRIVAVGEQFRVVFNLSARPQEFAPPSFEGFLVLAGPSTSSSTSVQIINGRMTQSSTYSYTYIVEAEAEGVITLGAASARIGNQQHTTQPIAIEVVRGGQPGQGAQPAPHPPGARPEVGAAKDDREIFVTIETDRDEVYRGQPVLATIRIYTRQGIAGFQNVKFPPFTGFWNQEVETPESITFERVNVDGRIYNMGVIRKYLLLPLRAGELVIDPFEVEVLYHQRGGRPQSIFDEFFGAHQTMRRRLVSAPVTVTVRNLPPNAPASFAGAVGRYTFDVSLDQSEVKTNEAVTLRMRVSGSGNLRLVEPPALDLPPGFEKFDPKITEALSTTPQGITGNKTFEYVLIPRAPGVHQLPGIEFSFFDPAQGRYAAVRSQPLTLTVTPDATGAGTLITTGVTREDVRFIGQDIRFIKTEPANLSRNGRLLYGSPTYWASTLTIVAAFGAGFMLLARRRTLEGNAVLARSRRAVRVARKRLQAAHGFLVAGDSDRFYEELLRALWGYTADKLVIPLARLTRDTARDTLLQQGIHPDDVEEFLRIITEGEFARYAPRERAHPMGSLYDSTLALIAKFEASIGRTV